MAKLTGFNANEVDPAVEFEPIPPGKYIAAIVESEEKPNKAGTGKYLELKFQVLEGECKGRYLWARLNMENPNAIAVQIARAELSAICRAVGVAQPQDSVELHNRPLLITVKNKHRDDNNELTNEIRGFAKADSAQGQPQQMATSGGGSTPPWKR